MKSTSKQTLTAIALAFGAVGAPMAANAQYVPPGGFEDEEPTTPGGGGNTTTITKTTTNTNTATSSSTSKGGNVSGNTFGGGDASFNGTVTGGNVDLNGAFSGNIIKGGESNVDLNGALANSGNSKVELNGALAGSGNSSIKDSGNVDLNGALAGSGNSSSTSGVKDSGNSSVKDSGNSSSTSGASADNNGNNNGNVAMNGIGNTHLVNSFRSYAYSSGPAVGAAVDRCLAVVGWSGSVGAFGVQGTFGKNKAEFIEGCAAIPAALQVFASANGDVAMQAVALKVLMNALPQHFTQEAIDIVVAGMNVANAECAAQGGVVASPLAAFGLKACKPVQQQGYVQHQPQQRQTPSEVNVNVTVQNQAARAATTARKTTKSTARPRSNAGQAAAAQGSCPIGQTLVTRTTTSCEGPKR